MAIAEGNIILMVGYLCSIFYLASLLLQYHFVLDPMAKAEGRSEYLYIVLIDIFFYD